MAKTDKKKPKRGVRLLFILLVLFVLIPLIYIAIALTGRVSPGDVIPDSYTLYVQVPDPIRLAGGVLDHETLPEILSYPEFAPAIPLAGQIRNSPVFKNPFIRFFLRGSLEGALLAENQILAAWDSGLLSPLLRVLPALAGYVTLPGLYYVRAGKNSRFEYRPEQGAPFFIGPYHNLLVISNDPGIFESVLTGRSRDGDLRGSKTKPVTAKDADAALLVSPESLKAVLSGQNPRIAAALNLLDLPSPVELSFSLAPAKLDIRISTALRSQEPPLKKLLERNSRIPGLASLFPGETQYGTILSAGTLGDLYSAAAVCSGPELETAIRRADSSSRLHLGLTLEELLFSWTGEEFAVFGMEGRPSPVYVVQVKDEGKREAVFNRAFRSVAVNENIRLNLDGVRIPRIEVPDFLRSLLQLWNIRVPAPYYTVRDGYLFVSESAETLLAAIREIQKNEILPKTAIWRELSKSGADVGAFTLYYSLDISLPFFLKGNTAVSAVLGLYRQGLLRLNIEEGRIALSLSVIPGAGGGLAAVPGYPLELEGKLGNQVYGILPGKASENRILLTGDNSALLFNPQDNSLLTLDAGGPLWFIPAAGLGARSGGDSGAWIVSVQGRVTLVNGSMEPQRGFPLLTGLRLSAPPASLGGNLFLCDEDGKVYVISSRGSVTPWETAFTAAIRSPPSFLSLPKSGGTYAAVYPKSFLGEIWLLDTAGKAFPGWPAPVSGIAFGSPLLFLRDGQVLTAFITQAGELSVFDEKAVPLPPFPLELEGVFFKQPVFDGEFLWLAASDGALFQVSLDGTVLYQRIPGLSVKEEGYITALDVDGDKAAEVFVTGEGNALHGYARNFSSLNGFPLPLWGRPFFGDLNGDGKIECIGAGLDNKLYRWQFK
ncbi:MAG: hypothetical protein LBE14_01510 [Treponema sp.]|jgi:hypothetical protein|nr:hypothetical protein [Treponema sp.]